MDGCQRMLCWMKEKWKVKSLSRVWLFATTWTVVYQLLHPWNFPGKNTGVDCHFLFQGSSQPRDRTWVSCIAGRCFTVWATSQTLKSASSMAPLTCRSRTSESTFRGKNSEQWWPQRSMRITQEGIQGNFLGEGSVLFCDTGVLPRWLSDEKSACRRCKRCGFDPWVRKIPWRRKWQPTPVFLPAKYHGQRSLVGYSPYCRRVRHDWGRTHTSITSCVHFNGHNISQ